MGQVYRVIPRELFSSLRAKLDGVEIFRAKAGETSVAEYQAKYTELERFIRLCEYR